MTELKAKIAHDRLMDGHFGDIHFGAWGIECSDRNSFVTLTDTSRKAFFKDGVWHLASGRLKIELKTAQTSASTLTIKAAFTALDDIALQDAVIRTVFDKSNIKHGIIADQTIPHTNSDKYRLHKTDHAKLVSKGGHVVTVHLRKPDGTGRFEPYLYLRDRDDHWIIHARMLPIDPVDHVWLRWANRLFTASAPNAIARLLWKCKPTQKLLWRLRERLGRSCPEIQAVPLNILKSGQSLSMEVTCHFR
ncbi:MAG: hypothetical protein ACMZ66_07920 [Thalassospira sp.]|uniref:hypothetical protein n=1 Tax=Thalassospira sp. TaxID=1912094 RepID=UPI003A8366F3